MLSAGQAFAGLLSVVLQTIIRAIVYAVSDEGTDPTKIYFWIFFGIFYASLLLSFAIAWFVPKMESFKHFEQKAIAMKKRKDEEAIASANDSGGEEIKSQPKGVMRFLSLSFLSDISLPVCLIFCTMFSTLLVWPTLAQAYKSGSPDNPSLQYDDDPDVDMLVLQNQGWPFCDESMVKWWWSPFVIGAYNLADFIGRNIPSTRDWIRFFPLWFCRILASARAALVILMVCLVSPDIGINSSLLFLILVFTNGVINGVIITAC